jgi:hypothetical protein
MYDPCNTSQSRTGRTTRMLEEAIRHALQGKTVHVVAVSETRAEEYLHNTVRKIPEDRVDSCVGSPENWIRIKGGEYLHFITKEEAGINWNSLKEPDEDQNVIVLIDHFVIEIEFYPILAMLHRWDPRPEEGQEPRGPDPDRR